MQTMANKKEKDMKVLKKKKKYHLALTNVAL